MNWRNASVIFGALLVGAVALWPHILLTRILEAEGQTYAPYTLRGHYDMANVVGPRLREALDGNSFISEVDLFEYKDGPAFLPSASEIYAVPLGLFTDTVTGVLILSDVVLTVVIFGLIFWFALLLTGGNFYLSLFSALLVSLYREVAIDIPPSGMESLSRFWHTINPFVADPHSVYLTVRQSFMPGAIPLLLTFIALLKTLQSPSVRWACLGGIAFAATAYTYPYHFLYVATVCGFAFLFMLATRQWATVKRLIVFGVVAGIAMVPFALNFVAVHDLPQYEDIFARFGAEHGRHLNTDNWKRYLLCLGVAAVVWQWGKATKEQVVSVTVVSMLLASIVVLNMGFFLGFSIHIDHWLNRDIVWAFTAAYIVLGSRLLSYAHAHRLRWLAGAMIALALLLLTGVLINSVRNIIDTAQERSHLFTLPSEDVSLYAWLNMHTKPEEVVMTPSLVRNTYIPLYTHNNIFVPRGLNTIAPDAELVERLFITYKTFGISEAFLRRTLLSDSAALPYAEGHHYLQDSDEYYETAGSYYLFHLKYLPVMPTMSPWAGDRRVIPESVGTALVEAYRDFSCSTDCFSRYHVDYLVLGEREAALSDVSLEGMPNLERVGEGDGWVVYRVNGE